MWSEIVTALVVGGFAHWTGIARGRYGDKKRQLATWKACSCGHSIAVHGGKRGTGRCDRQWSEKGSDYQCQCKRFTPKKEDE